MTRTFFSLLLTLPLFSCQVDYNLDISLGGDAESFISALNPIHPSNFNIDQSELDNIRREMQRAVDSGHISGALLLVGNRDGAGVLETVGTQTAKGETPVNKDTIFRIYSMTKPVISVAAMTLVEDGMLGLDDPVSDYIPSFADLQVIDLSLIHI